MKGFGLDQRGTLKVYQIQVFCMIDIHTRQTRALPVSGITGGAF